ncbi:MAG: hypothetical protein APR62_03320 [Smithella sp. SDB]|nr:MAG: hypothetical protein APR62_03320 [Smithella sp. SDB]
MHSKKTLTVFLVIFNILFFCVATSVFAQGGEGDTFAILNPEALFVLDLSGSMNDTPAETGTANWFDLSNSNIWGTSSCDPDYTNCPETYHYFFLTKVWDCRYGYCKQGIRAACNKNCSKMAILKRSIFSVLDSDNNGVINDADYDHLGIKFGYMRLKDAVKDDQSAINNWVFPYGTMLYPLISRYDPLPYTRVVKGISDNYYNLYCGNGATSCQADSPPQIITDFWNECITAYDTDTIWSSSSMGGKGSTPLATLLKKANIYLTNRTNAELANPDPCGGVKKKFVILISDGEDTTACDTGGSSSNEKTRRSSVTMAKNLADAGYKVFVIGFGSSMPETQKNTLNWMAYYGGTDNPNEANTSPMPSYNPAAGLTSSGTWRGYNCGSSSGNDPGSITLAGYAYVSENENEIVNALKSIMGQIIEAAYSFTQTSIQTVRTSDENYLYEASFYTLGEQDPLWIGHLKRFGINDDGTIKATADWDAGEVLKNTSADYRTIKTLVDSTGLISFTAANLTNSQLDVATGDLKADVVNFIRGGDVAYITSDRNYIYYGWKLGDIYHTSPQAVGTPNLKFNDKLDGNNAFSVFRNNNIRTSANGKRLMIVGANDGQLHAFKTNNGSEAWSFIPPNLLTSLKNIAHTSHPTLLTHQYFVDGPLSAADIWLGSDGSSKSADEWHSYLVMAEGRGGNQNLWGKYSSCICPSSDSTCTSAFNSTYSATYNNYCGYYTLDVTDVLAPQFKWTIGGTSALSSTDASYLGQPWSEMYIGRVKIGGAEKWVGFIGGGYNGSNCTGATCDTRGKGFFVIDLNDGTILKSFTRGGANVTGTMNYDFAGNPAVIDFDNDGYLDTAYIGDTGGNIWRFKFCCITDDATCGTSSWTGNIFYQNTSTAKPIYTSPTIAHGSSTDVWVFFCTGDKTDPTNTSSADRLYGLKEDGNRTLTYTDATKDGWYISLTTGEKCLADPVVFNKVAYFTTYSAVTCDAKVYGLTYNTGGGGLSGNQTSVIIGKGIPSGVVISQKEGTSSFDAYISTSQIVAGTDAHTKKLTGSITTNLSPMGVRYWRDLRLQ